MISCAVVYDDATILNEVVTFIVSLLGANNVRMLSHNIGEALDVSEFTHIVVCKRACCYSRGECTLRAMRKAENSKVFVVIPAGCLPRQAFACVSRGAHEFNTDGPKSATLFVRLELFFLGGKPAVLGLQKQWKFSTGHMIMVDAIDEIVLLVEEDTGVRKTFHLAGFALKLLILLITKRGANASREEIHTHLYKVERGAECRKVDLVVTTVRKVFKTQAGIDPIKTNHGSGYAIR